MAAFASALGRCDLVKGRRIKIELGDRLDLVVTNGRKVPEVIGLDILRLLVRTHRVGLRMLGIRHCSVDLEVVSVPVREDPLQLRR